MQVRLIKLSETIMSSLKILANGAWWLMLTLLLQLNASCLNIAMTGYVPRLCTEAHAIYDM